MSEGTEIKLAHVAMSLIKAGMSETAELCNRAYNEMGDQRRAIATLEQRISAHNERCREDCQAYTNLDCVDARNKGLTCEHCPQHFLIED